MKAYSIISYDVWGNAEDGYTVNAAYYTGRTLELEDDEDATIIAALVDAGELFSSAIPEDFAIEGDPEYTLYVSSSDTYYPYLELQRVS